MNIFEEVKQRVSARNVAEVYGLKVNRNGMACCPFHNDKNPSMKIDATHFHCFGCGAHGDAIGYVAKYFGLSQYDAACKINDDFFLNIDTDYTPTEEDKKEYLRQLAERERIILIRDKFKKWVNETIDMLRTAWLISEEVQEKYRGVFNPVIIFSDNFAYILDKKSLIDYWLDILCLGEDEEKQQLFRIDGKEVRRVAAGVKRAGEEILGRSRMCTG